MSLHDQILDTADTLTEPQLHNEPYTQWVGGHRKTRHHTTVLPGLIAQLYQSVHPTWSTTDQPGGTIPTSRPPLELEALSRHQQITAAVTNWCKTLRLDPRPTVQESVRALVGATGRLDHDDRARLLADLRRWAGWCKVYLGLEHVQHIRGTPCPLTDCQQRGTLRINLTTATGMCTACGAAWNTDTIGLLGEHIRTSRTAKMGA